MTKEEYAAAFATHVAALIEMRVPIDEIIGAYGSHHAEGLQAYVEAVDYDDELERAGGDVGMVSEGADPGAWVLAWVWVRNDEAGIENEPDEDEEEDDQ
jgi:hypothetical protein